VRSVETKGNPKVSTLGIFSHMEDGLIEIVRFDVFER
jgi:hypothetical protein